MIKRSDFTYYVKYSALAAVLYAIPVWFFVRNADYTDAWLLYLGNFFFLFAIVGFMFAFNKRRQGNAGSAAMVVSGHIATAIGVVISCLLAFIILMWLVPGLFDSGNADKTLTGEPANMVEDKTDGLNFMLFANAVFGNVSAGSFVSILFSFTIKRDQTKESPRLRQREL